MQITGFLIQIFSGTVVTLKLALSAVTIGLCIGLVGALVESIPLAWLRYVCGSVIFLVRGLPELLVLFFIYFGLTSVLSTIFNHYIDISAFMAGTMALSLIFGAYAAQVFRGAFLALPIGQTEAGRAMGFSRTQVFLKIQLPQVWRHAIPGLGNLWLVLLKDTAIVSLIGLPDMMSEAKVAASTTHQPFTFYLIAALIYLIITSASQKIIDLFYQHANRYINA